MNWKLTATEDEFIKRGFTNWKRLFDEVMATDKEPIEYIAFNNILIPWAEAQLAPALHQWFYDGCGDIEPFTAWSANWVYFPVQYDGRKWIGKAPRHPRDYSCEHQGG